MDAWSECRFNVKLDLKLSIRNALYVFRGDMIASSLEFFMNELVLVVIFLESVSIALDGHSQAWYVLENSHIYKE